mgnify:CR=1 FL=1
MIQSAMPTKELVNIKAEWYKRYTGKNYPYSLLEKKYLLPIKPISFFRRD